MNTDGPQATTTTTSSSSSSITREITSTMVINSIRLGTLWILSSTLIHTAILFIGWHSTDSDKTMFIYDTLPQCLISSVINTTSAFLLHPLCVILSSAIGTWMFLEEEQSESADEDNIRVGGKSQAQTKPPVDDLLTSLSHSHSHSPTNNTQQQQSSQQPRNQSQSKSSKTSPSYSMSLNSPLHLASLLLTCTISAAAVVLIMNYYITIITPIPTTTPHSSFTTSPDDDDEINITTTSTSTPSTNGTQQSQSHEINLQSRQLLTEWGFYVAFNVALIPVLLTIGEWKSYWNKRVCSSQSNVEEKDVKKPLSTTVSTPKSGFANEVMVVLLASVTVVGLITTCDLFLGGSNNGIVGHGSTKTTTTRIAIESFTTKSQQDHGRNMGMESSTGSSDSGGGSDELTGLNLGLYWTLPVVMWTVMNHGIRFAGVTMLASFVTVATLLHQRYPFTPFLSTPRTSPSSTESELQRAIAWRHLCSYVTFSVLQWLILALNCVVVDRQRQKNTILEMVRRGSKRMQSDVRGDDLGCAVPSLSQQESNTRLIRQLLNESVNRTQSAMSQYQTVISKGKSRGNNDASRPPNSGSTNAKEIQIQRADLDQWSFDPVEIEPHVSVIREHMRTVRDQSRVMAELLRL
ncbi:hypothetical protein HDU76_007559 [Blyttiomyces sp. JEL0837]|nr:hypothetical protein HDU76_007559 [Blyttiomyces sp. JEL0837]